MHECTRRSFVHARCAPDVGEGGGSAATGMGGRERRRGRRGPKGLTRALKIENSKWPIFPADGTETKSRPAFIMTCIAVRAAVICTVSLQNARVYRQYDGDGQEHRRVCVCVYLCARGYTCACTRIVSNDGQRGNRGAVIPYGGTSAWRIRVWKGTGKISIRDGIRGGLHSRRMHRAFLYLHNCESSDLTFVGDTKREMKRKRVLIAIATA